ncbi:hypothetical protein LTR37_004472 [Vermiconidia calcicola]|uniref:Uncharacterized protein n=1 Tax=Vermiconidia calcicola TaxID=1690605 RepID=A0ACC3NM72_9PEZI|nr:hypothetical protein LTR37_004472 [Vermiconidia calcicola]
MPEFELHTYYRSSCSGRLRIALNLKNLHTDYVYVHLFKGEQRSEKHMQLNPSGTVPVLLHQREDEGGSFSITQSIAALEYLEEIYPDQVPLLPPLSQPPDRAKVRTLVNIVAIDIQPFSNRSVVKRVTDLGGNAEEWNSGFMTKGLQAYEAVAAKTAGRYSVGDRITLADVCLVPAIWAAEKHDVELQKFPTVMRIYKAMSELEAVQKAHWSSQEDTPADMAWL